MGNTLEMTFKLQNKATSTLTTITNGFDKAAKSALNASKNVDKMDKSAVNAGKGMESAARSAKGMTGATDSLSTSVGKLVKALGLLATAKKAFDFGKESFALASAQSAAERMLAGSMWNAGGTRAQYNDILGTAKDLQGKTAYGDEAYIAGAAELSTYMSDPKALKSMMGTLSNYAAGMTGGASEINTTQMTDLATQLGKALNGTFDGLAKKGFTLTDQQKEIIKNGDDMQKALVLDEIINESWAGLAERMASLPENKIRQVNNTISDMKEMVGNQLSPATMGFYQLILDNSDQIQSVFYNIAGALNLIIVGFTEVASVASDGFGWIAENASWLAPVLLGIAGALGLLAIAFGISTAATWAFNAALDANPIVWIVVAIGACIGVVYALAAELANLTGMATTGFGMICGAINVAVQFFMNLLTVAAGVAAGIVNATVACGNNIRIAFSNAIHGAIEMFYNLQAAAMSVISNIAAKLNALPFVSIDVGGFEAAADNYAAKAAAEAGMQQEYQDINSAFDTAYNGVAGNAFSEGWASNAFSSGSAWGDGVANSIADKFSGSGYTADNWGGGGYSGGSLGTDADPMTVKGSGANGSLKVDMSDEDLKYMRDIAERDYVAKISTNSLAPNISVNFTGAISQNVDTAALGEYVSGILSAEIATAAEGAY